MNQAAVHPTDPPTAPTHRAATVVVGAGLGGLLAAITAADGQPRSRVVVLDPHPPGGRARVDERDGFLFNRGPRALYRRGPADRALRDVGVDTSRGGPPNLGGALAVVGGEEHRFPGQAIDSARTTLFTPRQKVELSRTVAAMWRADERTTDGQSLRDWLDARALDDRVRQFVEALVRVATYANAPEVFAAGPALANARAGIRPGVRYLDGGWQSLVDQLVAVATGRGVEIVRAGVRAVVPRAGVVEVVAEGATWEAASVVLAAGGPDAAASLLPERPASWGRLAPAVTAACLELGIRGVPDHRFALGIDEPLYGSTHAPPADLAPPGHSVVHLMRYQPADDDLDPAQQRAALDALAVRMGITSEMVVRERFLARMVVTGSLPAAATGGLAGRPAVAVAEHAGVLLAGDWVGARGAAARRRRLERRGGGEAGSGSIEHDGRRMITDRPTRGEADFEQERPRLEGLAYRITARGRQPRTSCRTPGCGGSAPTARASSAPQRGSPP
ncbi:NAD(P)-binding protein [Aquihabitans daechungensis]|uniref:NAD(P)-binding protein n=1 Tax=Aquihabitans daechungensis TaxID=1052257 RepID=UPI003B9E2F20